MNYNKILKLAYLYSYAISETYDAVNAGRTVDTICKMIKNFFEKNKEEYLDKEIVDFKMNVANMAQNKFNQLIVPYLQMQPVDVGISSLRQRLEEDVNQDDLQFFLHDLIHEILQEGSIKKFDTLDKEFAEKEEETLREMEESGDFKKDNSYWEEDEEGDLIFSPPGGKPIYKRNTEVYSLEDFIEEQVAESLTNKTKIAENGIYKYIKILMIGMANEMFNFNWSQNESSFEEPIYNLNELDSFLDEIIEQVSNDVNTVINNEYKEKAKKFLNSLKGWIRDIKNNIQKEYSEKECVYINNIFKSILKNTKNWIGSNFDVKERKIFPSSEEEFYPNPMGEKGYSKITDDFKMSLLRRWVLAVDKEVRNMIEKEK